MDWHLDGMGWGAIVTSDDSIWLTARWNQWIGGRTGACTNDRRDER